MKDKELLKNVIDALMDKNSDKAEEQFHSYLPAKLRQVFDKNFDENNVDSINKE